MKSYLDVIKNRKSLRDNPADLLSYEFNEDSEFNKLFACWIRDPRLGIGEKNIGRFLMAMFDVEAKDILKSGRADDIFYLGTLKTGKNQYWDYLWKVLTDTNQHPRIRGLVKKWMPREHNKKVLKYTRKFMRTYNISPKSYRKLTRNHTTPESILSTNQQFPYYQTIATQAFNKYKYRLLFRDGERFVTYMNEFKEKPKKAIYNVQYLKRGLGKARTIEELRELLKRYSDYRGELYGKLKYRKNGNQKQSNPV